MELYILDSLLRRSEIVDQFESLVWTERFSSAGDIQLKILSTRGTRSLFSKGTKLALNESYRMMEVQNVEDDTDTDGRRMLTVTGPSFEDILNNRVAKNTMANLTTEPKWVLTGPPASLARTIFLKVLGGTSLQTGDTLPFYIPGNILPMDTIAEPSASITVELEPMSVYAAIKQICDSYDLGFRFVRNFDASQIYFNIYAGSDRTTTQTILPPVVFSPYLENLQNIKSYFSSEGEKNVAYVFSKVGTEIVYAPGVPTDIDGYERKVLIVNASNIEAETLPAVASQMMRQLGLEELNKTRNFAGFEGEVRPNSEYKYQTHYNLGDLVEVRNSDGAISKVRVTEQTFVSDAEGERSYPALSLRSFAMPGTWATWNIQNRWLDMDAVTYWANV